MDFTTTRESELTRYTASKWACHCSYLQAKDKGLASPVSSSRRVPVDSLRRLFGLGEK